MALADRCRKEAAKIVKAGSQGGRAPTRHTPSKSAKQTGAQKQPTVGTSGMKHTHQVGQSSWNTEATDGGDIRKQTESKTSLQARNQGTNGN